MAYAAPAAAGDKAAVERGGYLFAAGGCLACHTDEKGGAAPLSGGPPLATPFGAFFAPNITPDPQNGIGAWSEEDFRTALRDGKGRNGDYLYPVFPYTSFTGMSDRDISDLYAYLMTRPPSPRPNKPNRALFPLGWRKLLLGWRTLFFSPGPLRPVAGQTDEWNRGRYLVEAVVHCQECHTPRNFLGARETAHAFAGNPHGPDGQKAPNLSSDRKTGLGTWRNDEIEELLATGQTPDGDFVGSGMADVVKGTGELTDADRHAIVVYIKSLPPLPATPK